MSCGGFAHPYGPDVAAVRIICWLPANDQVVIALVEFDKKSIGTCSTPARRPAERLGYLLQSRVGPHTKVTLPKSRTATSRASTVDRKHFSIVRPSHVSAFRLPPSTLKVPEHCAAFELLSARSAAESSDHCATNCSPDGTRSDRRMSCHPRTMALCLGFHLHEYAKRGRLGAGRLPGSP